MAYSPEGGPGFGPPRSGFVGGNFYQLCSGVMFQQLKSTRWIGVDEMDFSFSGVDLQSQPNQCSGLRIRFFLKPDT
jgi:hypothetical protein